MILFFLFLSIYNCIWQMIFLAIQFLNMQKLGDILDEFNWENFV